VLNGVGNEDSDLEGDVGRGELEDMLAGEGG
jgi:hypothetical protein